MAASQKVQCDWILELSRLHLTVILNMDWPGVTRQLLICEHQNRVLHHNRDLGLVCYSVEHISDFVDDCANPILMSIPEHGFAANAFDIHRRPLGRSRRKFDRKERQPLVSPRLDQPLKVRIL